MLIELFAASCAGLAGAGIVQSIVGSHLLKRRLQEPSPVLATWPAVTVLKPLCGDEVLLEAALASFCEQNYPRFQIVFGVQSAADPAIAIVRRLQQRFPHLELDLVVDPRRHGRNNKIGNLLNMVAAARHDVLVIADSDIHAPADTLKSVVAGLMQPGVGLVTSLYTGVAASPTLAGALGAAQINHTFLPGALMARGLGRQDCLGAIMALGRPMLERIGGLAALSEHLADDALLGKLVRATGASVALARVIPATTVPETRLSALMAHELRWMRTVKSVAPVGFVLGVLQYPLFWATAMLAALPLSIAAWLTFAGLWAARTVVAKSLDRSLHTHSRLPIWCIPLRDILSVAIMVASYRSNRVAWRGQEVRVTSFPQAVLKPGAFSEAVLQPGKG